MSSNLDTRTMSPTLISNIPGLGNVRVAGEYTDASVATQYQNFLASIVGVYNDIASGTALSQNDVTNVQNSLAALQSLAVNGVILPDGTKAVPTIEMATSIGQLLSSFQAVGFLNSGGQTIANLQRWQDLSQFGVATLMQAAVNAPLANHTLQTLLAVNYIQQGNNILSNNLSQLENFLQATQDALSLLNSIQAFKNNVAADNVFDPTAHPELQVNVNVVAGFGSLTNSPMPQVVFVGPTTVTLPSGIGTFTVDNANGSPSSYDLVVTDDTVSPPVTKNYHYKIVTTPTGDPGTTNNPTTPIFVPGVGPNDTSGDPGTIYFPNTYPYNTLPNGFTATADSDGNISFFNASTTVNSNGTPVSVGAAINIGDKFSANAFTTQNNAQAVAQNYVSVANLLFSKPITATPTVDTKSQSVINEYNKLVAQISTVIAEVQKAAGGSIPASLQSNQTTLISQLQQVQKDMANPNTTIAQWLVDGTGNTNSSITGTYQINLTQAITGAEGFNTTQQQRLSAQLFLFQEFYQSASAALSTISQEIIKMAQGVGQ